MFSDKNRLEILRLLQKEEKICVYEVCDAQRGLTTKNSSEWCVSRGLCEK